MVRRLAMLSLRTRLALLWGVALLVILVVGTAGVVNYETATATLWVSPVPITVDVSLHGSPHPGPDQFMAGVIYVTGDAGSQATPTGKRVVPGIPAIGEVVVTDTCGGCPAVVPVPAATLIHTAKGIQFKTLAAVLAGTGGPVTVAVKAVKPGVSGNVAANTVTAFAGTAFANMTVDNPSPMSGGVNVRTALVIQQSDLERVRNSLIPALARQLNQSLQDTLVTGSASAARLSSDKSTGPEIRLSTMGMRLIPSASPTYSLSSTAVPGAEVDYADVTVTGTLWGVIFSEVYINQLILGAVTAKVPFGYQLTDDGVRGTYTVTSASGDGSMTVQGHGAGYQVQLLDAAALRSQVAGHTVTDARAVLEHLPGVQHVDLALQPPSMFWLPFSSSHITLKIRVQPAAGPA